MGFALITVKYYNIVARIKCKQYSILRTKKIDKDNNEQDVKKSITI